MMRRAITLLLVVIAVVALSPARPGLAADSFTFFGSGYGHGVGMSQWGAYGLVQQGWTHEQVLTHYFSGTKVAKDASPPESLRIGLTQGNAKIRLIAQAGSVDLHVDSPGGDLIGTIPDGDTWTVRTVDSKYKVLDGTGNRVGGQLWGGVGSNLYVAYEDQGARVKVPEGGSTYNHGYLEFNLYNCQSGCVLRLVAVLDPEAYLYGISEVPSEWPMESLEVQAIAARTYAFFKAGYGQHRNPCNCALYDTSIDQVYTGWAKEGGPSGDRWVKAVDNTKSEVVKYKGDLIQAQYTASSGGYTENNENVWGGSPIPYLRGVCDPGDYTPGNSSRVWTVQMSAQQVTDDLGLGIGTVTGFANVSRGVSGRIITTTVQGTSGTAAISGITLRTALGLRDDRVWINADRQVIGEIRAKYDNLGCSPGLPTSKQANVGGGLRQNFAQGTIYFKDGLGAQELTGALLDYYLSQGGPSGSLGFPTSDVTKKPNGSTMATFEHGSIRCTQSGSCSVS